MRDKGRDLRNVQTRYERVKVERGQFRVLRANVDVLGLVVRGDVVGAWDRHVEVRDRDLVLGADLLPDDDLVDVVALLRSSSAATQQLWTFETTLLNVIDPYVAI